MADAHVVLTFVTALGCGLSGGALFAFSSFVMQGLARLRPARGIAAMQSINVTAPTPVFMTALFGTGLACLGVSVWALADWDDTYGPWLLAGSVLYLAGPVGLTMTYHVPRNNTLARVDPADRNSEGLWRRYVAEWTRMNHVRAAGGLAAAAALTEGLYLA